MILGVYGRHNSGKTQLVSKLIEKLVLRGYSVASVKNIPKEFSIDAPGKDTWKHKVAGADAVVALSLNEAAFIFGKGMDLDEVLSRLNGYDVVLVEGCKKADIPKVAVGDVGDIPEEKNTVFRYKDNLEDIIGFIEEGIKSGKYLGDVNLSIEVDGKKVPANRFIQRLFANVIYGMVSSLKGLDATKDIRIELRREKK